MRHALLCMKVSIICLKFLSGLKPTTTSASSALKLLVFRFTLTLISFKITESLKTFGVTPTDDSLPVIVLSVDQMNDTLNTEVFDKIDGKLVAMDSLKSLRNDSLIDKIYNLKNCTNESQKWDLIVTRIATKDIV
ncbi:unnamed protein product [Oppiella nova]|uniref:Uncharacterized protein n=1 Tax=Oppiella nova TaxID=334625 RepID=A0A7R9QLU1_9ACAR|nr:unnamed protein product [Oppiella nova]CAG2168436.1 unnamed protein product [Oppiella nova]